MSNWTYIAGVVKIDTYGRSKEESMFIAKTIIDGLPKINGHEHSMMCSIIPSEIIYSTTNVDRYGNRLSKPQPVCSCVDIVLWGNFINGGFFTTVDNVTKWLKSLSTKVAIKDFIVRINDDIDNVRYINFQDVKEKWNKRDNSWIDEHLHLTRDLCR